MQDAPGYLRRKELTFACYLDPTKSAVIDDDHVVRLNYETYLFATSHARQLFLDDVVRFCGLVTDPVTKRRFRPGDASPRARHEKVVYLFESADSYERFLMEPEAYRLPGSVMAPM